MSEYLTKQIVAKKETQRPKWGMTVFGYTKLSGAPTSTMIKLEGEKFWRRLMVFQISNNGMCFVKILGKMQIVKDGNLDNL